MQFDIILVLGETYFDHPLCGTAVLKRLLERAGFSVGLIESPKEEDITKFGEPALFFGVSSGSIDSMLKNYTPLKKPRNEKNTVPDRAVIVYCNWIRKRFKDSRIVLGGTEATLRRFSHYDYWDNKLRKPIILDSRADILVFGSSEKQIVEIARRLAAKEGILGIPGTCIVSKDLPDNFVVLPSHEEVEVSKKRFCDLQNLLTNKKNLAEKVSGRYVLQYSSPAYTPIDLDDYYGLPFTRVVPEELRGFEFSVVTHRGCIGNCNFCSLRLTQGDRIISRSEGSILKEIESMTHLKYFKGNVDDLGGPSANMYKMDCRLSSDCLKDCIGCPKLDRSNKRLTSLLRKARGIKGIKNVYLRSGVRFDLASPDYIKEIACHHVFDTLRVAPEHVDKAVLALMNKDRGSAKEFEDCFGKSKKEISYYYQVCHPGCTMENSKKLAKALSGKRNVNLQIFTPTPMTVSTCMYYTSLDPKTKKKVYVPYTYSEKKEQKRIVMSALKS